MPKIGSWWLKSVSAEPAEHIVWSHAANRRQSAGRAVGGKLFLTDHRLIFCPQLFDAATGGKQWEVRLADISGVGIERKGREPFSGGRRDRLQIQLTDGGVELFVVNDLEEVVGQLDAVCRDRRRDV
jgi:hypothetical protein